MWLWHWARRRWLDVLVWALVVTGGLCVVVALERHGLTIIRGRYGYWNFVPEAVHAYALALIPLWMAAVLHLLRQRPR